MLFIFDMGGVLTANVHVIPEMARELQISEKQFYSFCGCSTEKEDDNPYSNGIIAQLSKGDISPNEFWKAFSAASGRKIERDYWNFFFRPQRNNDVYKIVESLRKKHPVVCGTNSIDSHYMVHIERGDYTCFDKVYASHRMGIIKPDARFWEYIMHAENAIPETTFFTDDTEENCITAKKLGIHTHTFTDAAKLEKAVSQWL